MTQSRDPIDALIDQLIDAANDPGDPGGVIVMRMRHQPERKVLLAEMLSTSMPDDVLLLLAHAALDVWQPTSGCECPKCAARNQALRLLSGVVNPASLQGVVH